MAKPGVGMGTIFSHSSNWFAYQEGVNWDGIARAMVDVTHLGTAIYSGTTVIRRKVLGDIVDIGSLKLKLLWERDAAPPIFGDAEVITLTSPVPKGKSAGAILTGEAGVTSLSVAIEKEGVMMADAEVTFTGESFSFTASV